MFTALIVVMHLVIDVLEGIKTTTLAVPHRPLSVIVCHMSLPHSAGSVLEATIYPEMHV